MSRMLSLTAALAAVGALLVTSTNDAEAALSLRLDDGAGNVVTVSEVAGSGMVFYNGAVGSWGTNVSTGLSDPILVGPYPHMDLNSINVSGGTGTLTIMLTDTDFSWGSPTAQFLIGIGGTTAGEVSFQAYINTDNGAFSTTGTKIADLGVFSGGAFSGSTSGEAPVNGAFSVTLVATITHTGQGQVSSFDGEIQVPEPGSLALFGIGLLGLGFLARRRTARHLDA